MAASGSPAKTAVPQRRRGILFVTLGGAAVLAMAGAGIWWILGASAAPTAPLGETARAVRERLVVTVTESGEIDAKRSTNVACQVESQSTIVWVIDEGTLVQPGDKLVQLDSAELQERLRTQDMAYKTALAAFEKAEKTFLITQSTRESLLSTAGLTSKFALMDYKKYLGTEVAERLIGREGGIAFDTIVKDAALGGAALQNRRKLESDIDLAAEELSRAASKVEWTRTLKEKGYVTGSELQADELAYRRQQVAQDEAKTALDLFLVYEFPKAAEKFYTDWLESKREYDRVDARSNSEVESTRADRDNKQEALALEETRLKKVQDQLEKCTILAPQPGMVVYDTSGGRFDRIITIEPGATVRHQQNLIKLPDMSEMNVKVKLHESVVKQVSEGAMAYVTIDAFPKDRLTGRVTKIAVMPDRSQSWMNPGLKQYVTEVTLDASPSGLKPGMSAQVEILVDTRDGVLQVPVSAVFVDKGFQVVYVKTATGTETRRIEVGLSNERMVEVAKGLQEGEEVYLYKPAGTEELKVSEEEMKAQESAFEGSDLKAPNGKPKPPMPQPPVGPPNAGRAPGEHAPKASPGGPAPSGGRPGPRRGPPDAADKPAPRNKPPPGDRPAAGPPLPAGAPAVGKVEPAPRGKQP
jgi:RND family efflux transporter MFP subunit